jgi:hypothetical protein
MGTCKLDHAAPTGEPTRCSKLLNAIDGLCDKSVRLSSERLLGSDGFAHELRQAAGRAQPHLERVGRIGIPAVDRRKVIAGGLVAQVEYQVAGPP